MYTCASLNLWNVLRSRLVDIIHLKISLKFIQISVCGNKTIVTQYWGVGTTILSSQLLVKFILWVLRFREQTCVDWRHGAYQGLFSSRCSGRCQWVAWKIGRVWAHHWVGASTWHVVQPWGCHPHIQKPCGQHYGGLRTWWQFFSNLIKICGPEEVVTLFDCPHLYLSGIWHGSK